MAIVNSYVKLPEGKRYKTSVVAAPIFWQTPLYALMNPVTMSAQSSCDK